MRARVREAGLGEIAAKVEAGERLSFDDGVQLFACDDLLALGALANREREKRHAGRTYFNYNLRLEATNVCVASCLFCSFARLQPDAPEAYTMSLEEAWDKLRRRADQPLTEVHVVNGLHPDLPFSYYTDLLAGLKRIRPCLMTSVTTILGLAPIFLHPGRGSDVMQPMAIPSVGGMAVALITLFVIPCLYCLVKEWHFRFQHRATAVAE